MASTGWGGFSDWAQQQQQPLLPSHGIGVAPSAPLPPGLPSFASGGNSIMSLMQGGQPGENWADISSLLGSFSSGQKANRALEGQFTQGHDRLALEAQEARNRNESDALKKLGQTSYLLGGGSQFKPPTLSIGGKTYNSPDLGYGPQKVSDAEKSGAAALQGQMQARLSPGGSFEPTPLSEYAKPGTAEKIGDYAGLATGGLGALSSITGKGIGSLLGLGGGGSAASATGAGAAGAGGGIGSAIAGFATNPWTIGIAGALGGGLLLKKLLSGPSKEEKQGRSIEGDFENSLGGFQGMMNAVGQAYAKKGLSSAQAQADVKAMLDAEKKGPQATQAALQKIQAVMG